MPGHGLRLPQSLLDEMIAHCRSRYPKEACGILAGHDGLVLQAYPMTNVDQSPISYQMDPKEQLQVMRQMRQANQQMLAIYHSHTASAAYPSPVDVKLAVYPEVSYILVSLRDTAKPELRAFRIVDGSIHPDDLQVEG
jgi:proteasome lid subunit RPN8/RPN11